MFGTFLLEYEFIWTDSVTRWVHFSTAVVPTGFKPERYKEILRLRYGQRFILHPSATITDKYTETLLLKD
jgi:hypothetical protein